MYYVGSPTGGYSSIFWFKTFPQRLWMTKLAVIGDLGAQNAISLPYLQNKIHENQLDALIHAGDFAYDLRDFQGFQGDRFMEEIESVAAYVPYMTCPGNHEHPNEYNEYRNRFLMPYNNEGNHLDLHYSFVIGPIHFVSLNTEVYYKHGGNTDLLTQMYQWLVTDLEQANKYEKF